MANFVNNTGYLNNSPHRFNPFNIIKSNTITMNNVSIPLLLKPNKGRPIIAMPNSGQYYFPKASHVFETPLFQQGGIYDLMVAHGLDGSYKNRKAIFDKYFKGQYTGSAKQNIQLVKDLNSGKVDFDGNVPMQKSNIPEMLKKPVEIPIKQKTLPFQIIKPTTQPVQNFASTKQTKSSLVNQRQINAGKAGILASTLANQLNKNKTTLAENIGSTGIKMKNITGNADIDYFINKEFNSGKNKYLIVDRATGTIYYGNNNKHLQTKAGLGKNNANTNSSVATSLSKIETLEKQGKQKEADALKSTLLGKKELIYSDNIYGFKGYYLNKTGEAIHAIYPIEYKQRKAAITKGNFNVSYGCTNVDQYGRCIDGQSPLNSIISIMGNNKGDSAVYIDTRNSRALNEKILSKNRFQPGGSYNDKFGLHVKSLLKNFSNPELYQLSDCPEGYVKDEKGDCIPDTGYDPSQYQKKGMPSVPIKNSNGVTVGGLSTSQPFENKPVDQQNPMKLKRSFGTPNIPNIIGTNLISFGLAAFSNNVEEARQKAFAMKQMNDPNFNGTFSNADNDYGVDPYVQTGQLRPTFQKGGYTPIIVNNLNDPRLRAYHDSLNVYKMGQRGVEYLKNNKTPSNQQWRDFILNNPTSIEKSSALRIMAWPDKETPFQTSDNQTAYVKSYKKPVQPVIYQKPQQSNNNIIPLPNSITEFAKLAADPSLEEVWIPNPKLGPGAKKSIGFRKKVPESQEPTFKAPTRVPTDRPDLRGLPFNPNIPEPNLGVAAWDLSKPTNYSFTSPTGMYNDHQIIYFPDKNSWKNFLNNKKNISSQEGSNYGTATGYFQQGGTFDPVSFLYGDDKEQETKSEEKVKVKKTNRRITDEDVDNNDFDFMELIYGAGNNRTGSRRRRRVVNGNAEHDSLTEAIGAGESGNNYFAANPQPGQTAFGKYQFTNDAQKDAYEMSGGKQKYGSFETYQQLFKTSPQVQEEAMNLRMNQARKVVGDDPVAIALYHYAPKFGLMYKNGELDLDKNPAYYGIGKGVANPTFRDYLRTHGFKKYFKEGGEYNVDFDTLRYLQSQGVKFKILD